MEKIIKVEGMSCGHCEASVKERLMEIEGIEDVKVNLETKEVKIKGQEILDEEIKNAIDEIGFEVI